MTRLLQEDVCQGQNDCGQIFVHSPPFWLPIIEGYRYFVKGRGENCSFPEREWYALYRAFDGIAIICHDTTETSYYCTNTMQTEIGDKTHVYRSKVDASGRIVLPADVRMRQHIHTGDQVVILEGHDGLQAKTQEQAIREAQNLFAALAPSDVLLSEEGGFAYAPKRVNPEFEGSFSMWKGELCPTKSPFCPCFPMGRTKFFCIL